MELITCAFTGHRPHKFPWKYDETDSRCVRLKTVLTEQIVKLMETGVTRFFSGMAEGTDCWAASAVLELRVKHPELELHCVLPFEGQADKWAISSQEQYRTILEQANSIEYVSREYHKNCMLDRNRRLVDSASFLLVVYNGEWRGGTAATVRYARKLGRKIIIINPAACQISQEGFEQ